MKPQKKQNKKKNETKKLKQIKLSGDYNDFGKGLAVIGDIEPRIKQILLTDPTLDNENECLEDYDMEAFYKILPNLISMKNPIEYDKKLKRYPNAFWEFHVAKNKVHIKTNMYLSFGMNHKPAKDNLSESFRFFITFFVPENNTSDKVQEKINTLTDEYGWDLLKEE